MGRGLLLAICFFFAWWMEPLFFYKVKVKSLSRVRLFASPWTVAYQAPPSMGFFKAKVLEWVAISFSRGSSQPRDLTPVSCIVGRRFYHLSHEGGFKSICPNKNFLWTLVVYQKLPKLISSKIYYEINESIASKFSAFWLEITFFFFSFLPGVLSSAAHILKLVSCLENPRDEGAWWAAVYGVAQSRTRLKWLSSSKLYFRKIIYLCYML